MAHLKSVEALTAKWPGELIGLDVAAKLIGITEGRLCTLADGRYAPHFRIDGGAPKFKATELKQWAATALVERCDGELLPSIVKVISDAPRPQDWRSLPESIRHISDLRDVSDVIHRSGVYFLCSGDEVLYIGKSANIHGRIGQHAHRRQFDKAYFLPWPADDLDKIEAALIRAISPVENGKNKNGNYLSCASKFDGEEALVSSVFEEIK
jgi:hypothetical protein